MAPAAALELPFDLLHLVKECQLQHGLRTGDYGRYHKYLTNRLATVRKQLGFKSQEGAGKKKQVAKYQKREVTPAMLLSTVPNVVASAAAAAPSSAPAMMAFSLDPFPGQKEATHGCGGGRYLELLALLTERCMAVYEEAVQRRGKDGNTNGEEGLVGGFGSSNKKGSTQAAASDSGLLDARKKLNKAVKWAEELFAIASAVYPSAATTAIDQLTTVAAASAAFVVFSCEGYMYEAKGRCAAAHSGRSPVADFTAARESYRQAAEAINALLKAAEKEKDEKKSIAKVEQSFTLLVSKVAELDDRIMFANAAAAANAGANAPIADFKPCAMPSLYHSASAAAAAGGSNKNGGGASSSNDIVVITTRFLTPQSTAAWMVPNPKAPEDDEIPIYNVKVKENLREAAAVGAPEAMRAVVGAATITAADGAGADTNAASFKPLSPSSVTVNHIINIGQQLRIVDLYDRAIGFLNDALTHARSELRSAQGDSRRRQAQRLTLFLQFYISRFTADRTLFVIECLARRFWFHANRKTIGGSGVAFAAGNNNNASASSSSAAPTAASASKYAKKRAANKASKVPTASPLELVRLYTTAQDQLTDAYQTPGVEGSSAPIAVSLEQQLELCKAARCLYAGEAWAVTGNVTSALQGLTAAKKHSLYVLEEHQKNSGSNAKKAAPSAAFTVVEDVSDLLTAAISLKFVTDRISISLVVATVELNLAGYRQEEAAAAANGTAAAAEAEKKGDDKKTAEGDALTATRYLIDSIESDASFAVTTERKSATTDDKKKKAAVTVTTANLIPLPPSYMPIASKPAFVDIAATFVDFGDFSAAAQKKRAAQAAQPAKKKTSSAATSGAGSATSAANAVHHHAKSDNDAPQQRAGGGWLGGWGWGKKQ